MGNIIHLHQDEGSLIDITKVSAPNRKIEKDSILPSKEEISLKIADEHTAEPIKSIDDINRIIDYLVTNKRYRDNMMFVVGINFGLRVSDLLQLRFCHLIDENLCFRDSFAILEKKTMNTRKVQKNRYISINDAVIEAVTLYLRHSPSRLEDFMFKSESNRSKSENKPMDRKSVDRILKGIAQDLNLNIRIATHTLRKTFGYHQMAMSNHDPRKLLLLQKIFGHSTSAQTLDYIGITNEEINEAYMNLNLGSKNCYQRFNKLYDKQIG